MMARTAEFFKRHTYTPNDFYRYFASVEEGLSGDVEVHIEPPEEDELLPEAADITADPITIPIKVSIVNSEGTVHEWYNGSLKMRAVVDSAAGARAGFLDDTIGDANASVDKILPFVNGVCEFTVRTGGTWAAGNTLKLNVDQDNDGILGYGTQVTNHDLIDVQVDG